MGCSSSKLEEAASVQICKDRKNFIKQAIKHRNQLASSHIAYVQSLRRVSIALCTYVDENRYQYFLNSYMYHPYRDDKIFIEPTTTSRNVVVNYSRSQPKLPKIGTIEPKPSTIEFSDDLYTANAYQNPFISLNEDEYMDVKEPEKKSNHDDSNKRARELVEGENRTVFQERANRVMIGNGNVGEDTPGFTVHLSRIPASMLEVMKEVQAQFMVICDAASEVAMLLEVNINNNHSTRDRRPQLIEASNTTPRDGSNSNSDVPDEPFELFKSHKASLERLYEWEKKLYDEVKSGERIRLSYEKKFTQLKNEDLTGAEPSSVERTRASIRDLRTRLNLSFTSVESISKRIEDLRDEELHPQITELIQSLAKLWRTMADSHRIQKHTTSQAKLLLQLLTSTASPPPPVAAAASLASELRHWRLAFSAWTASQHAYATTLSNWAHSCVSDPAQGGPVLILCTKWAKMMEMVDERKAGEGIGRLEERMKAVVARGKRRQREEWEEEDWRRVICDGVGEVVAVVEEVTAAAAELYENLVREWREEERGGEEGRGGDGE
ncbi:DUF630 family protein (DUF630 and DUF632) [Rhynchospora pubera]|uniref:DUF630 family protein (DUF630 and DUF632) n=1 Tax=Rhynchospora pubera TaxID=906938 RepID=A0AAV8BXE4_9POAL|nr:DUF630 family protein (DUF630 and DUF632) [Rhynchospora pubera]